MKYLDNIFIVFGKEMKEDFSNIKTINTRIIPNTGDNIALKDGIYKVLSRTIDYRQVQDYTKDDSGRGGEYIYIFVEKL